ncbi:MAG: hypothetical protein V1861_05710 [Candidatus Micrarchaeota archaeon]
MNQMKKDTFLQRAREKVRNKASLYMGIGAMAICVGTIFAAKSCNEHGSIFSPPPPPLCENIRGDGICCESESYPYQRNPNGTTKMKNGAPVPNIHYSLEDCHDGDNVCQNSTKLAELRDAAGRPVTQIMDRFLDGRPITLPLESESSQDCIMQVVRDNPCGPRVAGIPDLTRPRMTGPRVLHSMRQRGQQEIEEMRRHPESLRSGDNYFVVINNYEEVCTPPDVVLPICTPTSVSACACPNHADCAPVIPPPPPTCGNAKLDAGEQCDPRYRGRPRGGCEEGTRCTLNCTCERLPPPPPTCPNNRVDPGEQCDPPGSSCGTNGTCNTSCQCDERPLQPPPDVDCRSEVIARLQNRISNSLLSDPLLSQARQAAGRVSTDQAVNATVRIRVEGGAATVTGISLSCTGCTGGSIPPSSINLQGIPPGTLGPCVGGVRVPLPPG